MLARFSAQLLGRQLLTSAYLKRKKLLPIQNNLRSESTPGHRQQKTVAEKRR